MATVLASSTVTHRLTGGQAWRRGGTTRTLTSAADAAQQILRAAEGRTTTSRQVLDGHQLQRLSLALNRRHLHPGLDVAAAPPPRGTPVPPGYHLAYFLPASLEAELGPDGTDRGGPGAAPPPPPPPFSRRMWAGGAVRWGAAPPLRVGDEVEERTRLAGAAARRARAGGEMLVVDVEKEFWGPAGLALVDRRSWVFRPPPADDGGKPVAAGAAAAAAAGRGGRRCSTVEDVRVDGSDTPQRIFNWSPVALFRFSALTFNAHMIHYSESWTRDVEGHPAVVVHGPLNLIGMLDYWRDIHGRGEEPTSISYRALSPLYAGDEYAIRTESQSSTSDEKSWEIVAANKHNICMRGIVTK